MANKNPYKLNLAQWHSLVKKGFEKKLPGIDAQLLMAPEYRRESIRTTENPSGAIKSAVLITLYQRENEVFIPFIERAVYEGVHSAQVSFPGGRAESEDVDLANTAFREANEEIGMDTMKLTLAGSMSPLYIPPSNYMVYPYVAIYEGTPVFTIDPVEVQSVIEIPLGYLLLPEARTEKMINLRDGSEFAVPGYHFKRHYIWGATAMILSEFIEMIRREFHTVF